MDDITRETKPSHVTCVQPFGDAGEDKPSRADNFRVTEDGHCSADRFPTQGGGSRFDSGSDSEQGGTKVEQQAQPQDSGGGAAGMSEAQSPRSIKLWQRYVPRFQAMSNVEHLSWYQQQMMNKRLGAGSSAAVHQVLWPRGGAAAGANCFPDSSLESASEYDESDSQRLVLCQQAKLNKRRCSPRPSLLVPHPGAQKSAKKLTPDLLVPVKTGTEKITSVAGGDPLPATTTTNTTRAQCEDHNTSAEPSKNILRKSRSVPGLRRKRAPPRGYARKNNKHKEPCLAAASKEDNTTFSQVSPWDTFSSTSHDEPSDSGSAFSAIHPVSQCVKRHRLKSAMRRKTPTPASKKKTSRSGAKRQFQSLAEVKTLSARNKEAVTLISSTTKICLDANCVREENLRRQRYHESPSQRLRNIACCRALPAPPVAPCENKLPEIKFPGVGGEGTRITRSQSIGDLDPAPWSEMTRDASCSKFTTLIEAVRVVDNVHGRKSNRSAKSSLPWAARGTSDINPSGNVIYWPSRPTSAATNTDNNASYDLSPTKPSSYDPVELLRKFRENLSCTRGKGLAATPRSDAPHSRKPFSLKSIMRTFRKTQKQCAMVPQASYISYDAELAVMKPSTRFTKTSKESSKSRISFRSEATNSSRFPPKIRSHVTKPRKTKEIFKKLIYV